MTYEEWFEGHKVPKDFEMPEKEGYDYDKIIWCNSLESPIRGHLGLSIQAAIPDSYTGNEAATEELQFYNMAGIFCQIPPADGRSAVGHVPWAVKRQRVGVTE